MVESPSWACRCGQMSCKWPNEPACKRVRVSNLLNCTILLDGATPFYDIDDLAMEASDLLDEFRDKGLNDLVQRTVVNRALEAAIQAHDAKVAAAQVAWKSGIFLLVWSVWMNKLHHHVQRK